MRCGKGRSHDREASPERRSGAIRRAGSLALILWIAFAAHLSAAEPEGLRQLRLCASAGAEDPAAHCREALKAGLDPAHAATANALLGFYVEPEPEELFERADRAEASYRAALAASPDAALAAFRLGRLLEMRGKTAEALGWLDRAVARRPDWVVAHVVRARALQELKREDEAVRALEDAATRADPDTAADVLMRAADIQEARGRDVTDLVRRAAAANPRELPLCVELGRRLSNTGQKAEATAILMTAFAERHQGDGQLLAALSSWLRVVGRNEESLHAALDAAAAEPDSPRVLRQLAFALCANGRLEQALETYRHWRSVAPRDEAAPWDQGNALQEAGRLSEAVLAFRALYDEFPERRKDAASLLGRALALAGRREEAIPLLKEAGLAEEAAVIERELSGRPQRPEEP